MIDSSEHTTKATWIGSFDCNSNCSSPPTFTEVKKSYKNFLKFFQKFQFFGPHFAEHVRREMGFWIILNDEQTPKDINQTKGTNKRAEP